MDYINLEVIVQKVASGIYQGKIFSNYFRATSHHVENINMIYRTLFHLTSETTFSRFALSGAFYALYDF